MNQPVPPKALVTQLSGELILGGMMFKKSTHVTCALVFVVLSLSSAPPSIFAQLSDTASWAALATTQYQIQPNITYLVASNYEAKLDVYRPQNATAPTPALIYFHGGGWVGGEKGGAVTQLIPYLEMGWAVINVQYRLGKISLAPAAVEDCRCALRWVISKAKDYNIDPDKLVLTGHSAGGHLSLITGMLPESAGLDRQCPGNNETLRVAAIINWYGITDVSDLLDGPNRQSYAVAWLGSMTNRVEVATRVSPLTYVRPGLPPILTIHGDADTIVPYSHAVRLHEALNKAGVANQLVTIPGGKHGGFNKEETLRIYTTIQEFLVKNKLLTR
ncbi:MAG: alpha/beta hydrolase [Terriglobia bacterium]